MIFQNRVEVKSPEDCKQDNSEIEVQIEKGAHNLDKVLFKYMANQMPGHSPGNVVVVLKLNQDKRFKRAGDHLMMDIDITLGEALLGWERNIEHLDGHIVKFSTRSVTKPGQVIVIQGEGMPLKDVPSQFGDLRLKVAITFPNHIAEAEKAALSAISVIQPTRKLEL